MPTELPKPRESQLLILLRTAAEPEQVEFVTVYDGGSSRASSSSPYRYRAGQVLATSGCGVAKVPVCSSFGPHCSTSCGFSHTHCIRADTACIDPLRC